jgi:hypothetical protein
MTRPPTAFAMPTEKDTYMHAKGCATIVGIVCARFSSDPKTWSIVALVVSLVFATVRAIFVFYQHSMAT